MANGSANSFATLVTLIGRVLAILDSVKAFWEFGALATFVGLRRARVDLAVNSWILASTAY